MFSGIFAEYSSVTVRAEPLRLKLDEVLAMPVMVGMEDEGGAGMIVKLISILFSYSCFYKDTKVMV